MKTLAMGMVAVLGLASVSFAGFPSDPSVVFGSGGQTGLSVPRTLDVDAFETNTPGPFTMTGFTFSWGENFVPLTTPITHGTITVKMWDWQTGSPDVDTFATPAGSFTFDIQTRHDSEYSTQPGWYFMPIQDYDIANPADHVTFSSNKFWLGFEFSHQDDRFGVAHAAPMGVDPDEEAGSNINEGMWWSLQGTNWQHLEDPTWGDYQSNTVGGDLWAVVRGTSVPAPGALALLGVAACGWKRRRE